MASTDFDSYVKNYVTTNRYYVEIGSSIVACFSECSGVGAEIDKEVYLEGGANDQQRIILKHTRFPDVTLKRGITDDATFSNWFSEIFNQQTQRRNVNILVFNQAGVLMRSWTLVGAIPVAWRTPNLEADGSSVAIEELTLAFEGLKVGKDSGGGEQVTRDDSGSFGETTWDTDSSITGSLDSSILGISGSRIGGSTRGSKPSGAGGSKPSAKGRK